MSLDQIEPRIKTLETIQTQTQVALTEIKNDFHHMTKAVNKIEEALTKFAAVYSRVENFENSVRRAHDRIDRLEVTVKNVDGDFNTCKATKLERSDIKELTEKVTKIEINSAKNAWVFRLAWLVVTPVVSSIVLGVMAFLFMGGSK